MIEMNASSVAVIRMIAAHLIGATAGRQWAQDCAEFPELHADALEAVRALTVPSDATEARYGMAQAILGDEATEEEADELMGLLFPVAPTAGMVRGFVTGASRK